MNKKDLSKVSIIKRMKLQNTVRKQIINLVASTLINKISYMLPKIWLPNLQLSFVTYLFQIRRF